MFRVAGYYKKTGKGNQELALNGFLSYFSGKKNKEVFKFRTRTDFEKVDRYILSKIAELARELSGIEVEVF